MLNDGIAAGRCAGLVLVASDPFLGQLKKQLSAQAHKALLRTVAADYTALNEHELALRLAPPRPRPEAVVPLLAAAIRGVP